MPRPLPSFRLVIHTALLAVAVCLWPHLASADDAVEFDPSALEFFEKQVRPILVTRCYECHSAKSDELQGGLRLDSRVAILAGGDTGPAVVPGKPDESLLVNAINYGEVYEMPPKSKMPDNEIAALTKWVEMGAPWPREGNASALAKKEFNLAQRRASHWAWQPIQSHQPPATRDTAWPQSEVDKFIRAQLERRNLTPALPADDRTLLRRLYFDLIGLPPTPEETDSFQQSAIVNRQLAIENVVDRLLDSPHFGERWARHWLDLVRYAETRGHEFEPLIPNAWQYRDYVIRAFNSDVPYDQFLTEHIAGDVLEKPRTHPVVGFNESILGTGFWFLGEEVHSPVDIRQDEADRMDNRLDVMSKTFLGVTVGCARCHDHKFDAISQADYYALTGFLLSSTYRQVRFETHEHNRRVAQQLEENQREARKLLKMTLDAELPTALRLQDYLIAAAELLRDNDERALADVAKSHGLDETLLSAWKQELTAAQSAAKHPLHVFAHLANDPRSNDKLEFERRLAPWRTKAAAAPTPGAAGQTLLDYSERDDEMWLADGFTFGLRPVRPGDVILSDNVDKPIAEVVQHGAARRDPAWNGLQIADGNDRDHGGLGGWDRSGRTIRTRKVTLGSGQLWYLVRGSGRAYAAVDSHLIIAGPLHGRLMMQWDGKPDQWKWIRHDVSEYQGHRAHVEFTPKSETDPLEIARVVESATQPPLPTSENEFILSAVAGESVSDIRTLANAYQQSFLETIQLAANDRIAQADRPSESAALAGWLASHIELFVSPESDAKNKLSEMAARLMETRRDSIGQITAVSDTALAMLDGNGVDENLLIRGSSRTPGKPVPRGFLEALGGVRTEGYGERGGRLQLARQMLADDNPLVARVIVNRVWHHLFGRGIVPTVDNFGVLGQPPTHPDLLDWLAEDFRTQQHWSMKQLIRSLVMSRTYQMSSEPDAQALKLDPTNSLLQHMPIRRLEAETIRDSILAVSGRLDRRPFGPPVEVHLTPFMQGRGRPGSGPLDGNGRRSIYTKIRRNFLPPMMLVFDMPIPFTTFGQRGVSNVPAQALILMNDPFVVEQTKVWAKKIVAQTGSPKDRIDRMYLTAFARPPRTDELQAALAFLDEQAAAYGIAEQARAADERPWADLAHVLFNTKEFIFIK